MILNNRELAFLHAPARAVGGPAIRNMATIGGNLFAPAPYGDLAVALLALDAQVMVLAGYGSARAVPLEEFLAGRARGEARLVAGIQLNRPQNPADFRFLKVSRVKPKGLSVLSIAAHLPDSQAASGRRAWPMEPWRRSRSAPVASSARSKARRLMRRVSPRPRGGSRGRPTRNGCHRDRMVSPRGAARASRTDAGGTRLGRRIWQKSPCSSDSTVPIAPPLPIRPTTCSPCCGAGSTSSVRNTAAARAPAAPARCCDGELRLACLTLAASCEGRASSRPCPARRMVRTFIRCRTRS